MRHCCIGLVHRVGRWYLRPSDVSASKKSRRGREPSGPRPRRLTLRPTTQTSRAALRLVIRQIQILSGSRRALVPCRFPLNTRHGKCCGERKASEFVLRQELLTTDRLRGFRQKFGPLALPVLHCRFSEGSWATFQVGGHPVGLLEINTMNGQERGRRPASRIRLVLRLLTGGLADAPLVSTISKYSKFPARRSGSSVATQLRREPPRRDQP